LTLCLQLTKFSLNIDKGVHEEDEKEKTYSFIHLFTNDLKKADKDINIEIA